MARNQEEYSLLTADADGVVVETLAEPGQVVGAGQVVVRLARTGPREATVFLPEGIRPEIGSVAQAVLYGSRHTGSPARLRPFFHSPPPPTPAYEDRPVP